MKRLTLILWNIRSTYNVGAILRTCDGFGVERIILTGYTPFFDKGLPHEQEKLRKQIHKTALGAEETVPFARNDDIFDVLRDLRQQNYRIFALEQGEASLNLADDQTFDGKIALILGEEVNGIPQDILSECDQLLEIPMCGQKESFNVSVAAGIAIWEISKSSLRSTRKYLRTQI